MKQAQYINPAALAPPPGNFSWLTRHGDVVWLSGMVAVDASGKIVGIGDAEQQARQIYANIDVALIELGAGLDNLVKTVTYVVGRSHLAGVQRIRAGLRKAGRMNNMPASTLLLVAGLASEDYLVEMDAVAVLPGAKA